MDRRIPLIAFCVFLGPFGGNTVLSMLHTIKGEFSTTDTLIAMTITLFMVPFALVMFFSGPLSDFWDRRKTIIVGLLAYSAGSVVCGLSGGIWPFLLGRVVQGLGFAFVNPVALALSAEIVPPSRRGETMGWMGSMTTLGTATGPLLGGVAAEADWRLAFYMMTALSLAAAALFALSPAGTGPSPSGRRDFLRRVARTGSDRGMLALCTSGALAFFAYAGVLTFLSSHLRSQPFDASDWQVGLVISAGGLAGIVVSPVAGRAADRFGRAATSALGLAAVSAIFLLIIPVRSFVLVGCLFAALGAVMAFGWVGIVTLSVEILPDKRGTASSLFNSARFFGYALAPQLFAVLFVSHGMGAVLALSATSALAAALVASSLRRRERGAG